MNKAEMGAEQSHLQKNIPPKLLMLSTDGHHGDISGHPQHGDAVTVRAGEVATSPMLSDSPLDPKLERELFGTPLTTEPSLASPDKIPQSKAHHGGIGPVSGIDQMDGAGTVPNEGPSSQANETYVQDPDDRSQESQAVAMDRTQSDSNTNATTQHEEGSLFSDRAGVTAGISELHLQQQTPVLAVSEANTSIGDITRSYEEQDSSAGGQPAGVVEEDKPPATVKLSNGGDSPNKGACTPTPIGLTAQQISQMITQKSTQQMLMPPPAAPASMLWTLKPSNRAKWPNEQLHDPAFCRRLIAVAVILFRQGRARDTTALGQFTIDLIGENVWNEELPEYMRAEALSDDNEAVVPLLEQAAEIIRVDDPASSAFLDGMLYMMN